MEVKLLTLGVLFLEEAVGFGFWIGGKPKVAGVSEVRIEQLAGGFTSNWKIEG